MEQSGGGCRPTPLERGWRQERTEHTPRHSGRRERRVGRSTCVCVLWLTSACVVLRACDLAACGDCCDQSGLWGQRRFGSFSGCSRPTRAPMCSHSYSRLILLSPDLQTTTCIVHCAGEGVVGSGRVDVGARVPLTQSRCCPLPFASLRVRAIVAIALRQCAGSPPPSLCAACPLLSSAAVRTAAAAASAAVAGARAIETIDRWTQCHTHTHGRSHARTAGSGREPTKGGGGRHTHSARTGAATEARPAHVTRSSRRARPADRALIVCVSVRSYARCRSNVAAETRAC